MNGVDDAAARVITSAEIIVWAAAVQVARDAAQAAYDAGDLAGVAAAKDEALKAYGVVKYWESRR